MAQGHTRSVPATTATRLSSLWVLLQVNSDLRWSSTTRRVPPGRYRNQHTACHDRTCAFAVEKVEHACLRPQSHHVQQRRVQGKVLLWTEVASVEVWSGSCELRASTITSSPRPFMRRHRTVNSTASTLREETGKVFRHATSYHRDGHMTHVLIGQGNAMVVLPEQKKEKHVGRSQDSDITPADPPLSNQIT